MCLQFLFCQQDSLNPGNLYFSADDECNGSEWLESAAPLGAGGSNQRWVQVEYLERLLSYRRQVYQIDKVLFYHTLYAQDKKLP